jgi:hypothetical protein
MNNGFGKKQNTNVIVYKEELEKLIKEYKKIKKYMKSSLYQVKTIDGTEKVVSELLTEVEDNPI